MNENASELRKRHPYTRPSVITNGPIFGLGYRPPWRLGNIFQARFAARHGLKVMLAQQSAREIERTGRSFQDVIDSATVSAFEAGLKLPWGADGDHLRNEREVTAAAQAGCTHFTYDVTSELDKGFEAVVEKVVKLYNLTRKIKEEDRFEEMVQSSGGEEPVARHGPPATLGVALRAGVARLPHTVRHYNKMHPSVQFTTEISLDEGETTTSVDYVVRLLSVLQEKKIIINEIAPRFPGYFEKAIDYYREIRNGKRINNTRDFEDYLRQIGAAAIKHDFRVCVHSGSDKFTIYPIIARVLKNNFHLKTAGTYYLEDLKIVARHNRPLFMDIFKFSFAQFEKDRASYELSADTAKITDLTKLNGGEIASLLQSGTGNDDLRQVLHVTYGSVLTARGSGRSLLFADEIEKVLRENSAEYEAEMTIHLERHFHLFY